MLRKQKAWLAAVGSIEYCVLCKDTEMLQVAHRNQNRGNITGEYTVIRCIFTKSIHVIVTCINNSGKCRYGKL